VKRIFIIHGDKGGVGKTEAAKRMAAAMMQSGKTVTLIDGDNKNPGFHAAFQKADVDVRCINVMKSAGLDQLFEIIAESPGDILIDLPARGSDVTARLASGGASEDGFDLSLLVEEIQAEIFIIFVIDQTRPPLVALRDELAALPSAKWVIVKNHREEREFDLFNKSKIKTDLEGKGAPVIDMIRLDPRVNDILENRGLNLLSALKSDDLSMLQKNRIKSAMQSWSEQMQKAGILDD
jgi:hypothetical protein